MFVYLKTGGGHYSPAKALSDYINSQFPDSCETCLVDGLNGSYKFSQMILERGYSFLQNHAVWIYEFIYLIHKIKFVASLSNYLITKDTIKYLTEQINREQPATIVVVHSFLINPVFEIIKKARLNPKVLVVVTDPYTAHPLWFANEDANFVVFSDELKAKCIDKGICENKISVFPFVVNIKYSKALEKDSISKLKRNYSLKHDKTVLIIGGADGLKNGARLILEIHKKVNNINLIFVCGRNEKLYKEILDIKMKKALDDLIVLGFAENVYELINLADLVITKCGASTIMEILLLKKIPLINSYLWEQEKGNLDYIVNNELGFYIKNSHKAAEKIFELVSNSKLINEYETNIARKNIKNGLPDVAAFIQQMSNGSPQN